MEMTNANALQVASEEGCNNVILAQLRDLEGKNLNLANGEKVTIVRVLRKGVKLENGTLMPFSNIKAVGRGFKVVTTENDVIAEEKENSSKTGLRIDLSGAAKEIEAILADGGFQLKHTRHDWWVIRLLAYQSVGFRKKALKDTHPEIVVQAERYFDGK